MRGAAFRWDIRTMTVAADPGRLYRRGVPIHGAGPAYPEGVCSVCAEALINEGTHGGWWSRALYPGEAMACELCGDPIR